MSETPVPATSTSEPALSPTPTIPAPEEMPAPSPPPATETAAPPQPGATPVAPAATSTGPAKEEPQNALTEQFTGYEWKALTEFRKGIPDALSKAYDDKPDAKTTPINLWGVKIDPTDLDSDARVSVVLMKFLRARNLNVSAATDMFVATLRWRSEFNVEAAMKEEFPADVFGQLGHIHGRDKGGRPVVYNIYGGNQDLEAVFGDVDRFLRWRVAFMEKSLEMLDFTTVDQAIQVHDYAGVSMSSRTPASKSAASQASGIFGSHYPELLYKKFFVNVPGFMTWLFWFFKTIIPSATFAKMAVVGSGPKSIGKALLPFIDADQLPKRYGGDADAKVFETKE
ncbi:CRAL/TRIO domain-containing protein [Roridomyces roridus]|uniref:Phosphatidylinositol transfer protein SFH5 n=1 Tax=Roridomyces roridus TaxID=1738132 RepID=A0AAD7BMC4_9AGAR|nr:CRAL/TRIO domain-containing protein [Roridomyces roridus]